MWHDLQYIQSDFPWPFEMHINHTSQLFFLFSCFNNKSTPIKFIKSSRGEGGREKGTCITKALASWMIISGLVCILTHSFADTSVWCSFHISGSHHPAPFSNSPISDFFLSLPWCCAADGRPMKSPRSQAASRNLASAWPLAPRFWIAKGPSWASPVRRRRRMYVQTGASVFLVTLPFSVQVRKVS